MMKCDEAHPLLDQRGEPGDERGRRSDLLGPRIDRGTKIHSRHVVEQDRVKVAKTFGVHQHRRRWLIHKAGLNSDSAQHLLERVARERMTTRGDENLQSVLTAHRGPAALAAPRTWASMTRNERSWAWPTRD